MSSALGDNSGTREDHIASRRYLAPLTEKQNAPIRAPQLALNEEHSRPYRRHCAPDHLVHDRGSDRPACLVHSAVIAKVR